MISLPESILASPTSLPTLTTSITELKLLLTASHQPPAIYIFAPNHHNNLISSLIAQQLSLRPLPPRSAEEILQPSVQSLLPKTVYLDLRELQSPKQLFDRVLNTLAAWNENEGGGVGEERMVWNDNYVTPENWNGRTKGLEVVRKERKRVQSHKRRRTDEASSDDDEQDDEGEWELEWDRSIPTMTLSGVQHDRRNESVDSFRQGLSEIFSLGDDDEPKERRFIVIEHGELLGELASGAGTAGAPKETGLGMTFASVMMYLDEALKPDEKITTIIISSRSWTKERAGMVGLRDPELISFPSLQQPDTVNILTARFETLPLTSPSLDKPALVALFRALASLVYVTFQSQIGTHVDEMGYLVAKFWPIWLGLVESNQVQSHDISRLGSHMKDDLSREIDRIANPRLPIASSSSSSFITTSSAPRGFTGILPAPAPSSSTSTSPPFPVTPTRKLPLDFLPPAASPAQRITTASDYSLASSLPNLAKFLLIASFFASFNPPKSDTMLFVRVDERVAKKGKKAKKATVIKPGTAALKAPIKSGPKSFPLERLLAILEVILPRKQEYASQSIDVLMQVSSLINLRLITRSSSQDKALDNVKLKCNVTRETIEMLAKTLKYNDWTEYLYKSEHNTAL